MNEILVGVLAAISIWAILASLVRGDPRLARRLEALRAPAENREGDGARSSRRSGGPGRGVLHLIGHPLHGDRAVLARALVGSGVESVSPDAFLGAKVVSAALGVLLGMRFGVLAPLAAPLLGWGGYRLPGSLLGHRGRARKAAMLIELEEVVDLMAVCARAGLNLPLALARVAERIPGAMGEELRRTVLEVQLGRPQDRALAEMAERNGLEELRLLVATLTNAQRRGAGVAASLDSLSHELWQRRRSRVEEQARQAPVKLLFPLVFLILPAFVLIAIAPLLLGAFRTLGF
ncbi:MAG: type II secretion system F family protein [Actinomycetota bacterium]